jgi:hypothetical protein
MASDPEPRGEWTEINVGVTRAYVDKDGVEHAESSVIQCLARSWPAQWAMEHLRTGEEVLIGGRIQSGPMGLEVIIESFYPTTRTWGGEPRSKGSRDKKERREKEKTTGIVTPPEPDEDDEIPM